MTERTRKLRICGQYLLVFLTGFCAHAIFSGSLVPNTPIQTKAVEKNDGFDLPVANLAVANVTSKQQSSSDQISPPEQVGYEERILTLLTRQGDAVSDAHIRVLAGQWAADAPVQALDFLLENQLYDYFEVVMAVAGKQADVRVQEWLEQNSGMPQFGYWSDSFYRSVAKVDPVLALEQIGISSLGSHQSSMLSTVIDEWALLDAGAALNWLQESNLPLEELESLRKTVLLTFAEQDPWQASGLYLSLSNSGDQRDLLIAVARKLSNEGISPAVDWASGLPSHHQKPVMAQLFGTWAAQAEPSNIVDYASERAGVLTQQSLFQITISEVAARAPELLLRRIGDFPDDAQSLVIEKAVVGLQGNLVPDNAILIDGIESESLRDFAWERMASYAVSVSPENAFKFSSNIANEGQRRHYLALAVRAWAQQNERAAISAINASSAWTDRQKRSLVDNIRNSN